jgi:hypothetical protein
MRMRRAQHHGIRLPREIHVIAEAAGAGDEPQVFLALNGLADAGMGRH